MPSWTPSPRCRRAWPDAGVYACCRQALACVQQGAGASLPATGKGTPMKAAVLHAANAPLTIEDVTIETPKRREVLIRTAFAGLCHRDLHFMEGLYPFPTPAVLGHESASSVEAVGEDST